VNREIDQHPLSATSVTDRESESLAPGSGDLGGMDPLK
jgi:hypothetical protein